MKKYQLSENIINQYPNMNSKAKSLLSNINKSKYLEDYVFFINDQLSKLSIRQQIEFFKKLVGNLDSEFVESVAELTYISFWSYFNWKFIKDPIINSKTPDFEVNFENNSSFLAEITTLRANHPHENIIIKKKRNNIFEFIKSILNKDSYKPKIIIQKENTGEILDELPVSTQPIKQSHRINIEVKQKYKKYLNILRQNNYPFVVCFYQPDTNSTFFIDDFQITNSLFGNLKINFATGDTFNKPAIKKDKYGNDTHEGIFCFDENKFITSIIFINRQYSQELNKFTFKISIYNNPLGVWGSQDPFSKLNFSVNFVDQNNNIVINEPNNIELY